MNPGRRLSWALRALAATLPLAWLLTACGTVAPPVPHCGSGQRLGLVAQSVPTASYVPCIATLPEGWRVTGFDVGSGHAKFSLVPDRGNGGPVQVELTERCDLTGATPLPAIWAGARSYARLNSVSPRYAGTLYDVFPGGCVRYRFAFERGPHIVLREELREAVGLFPRRQLEFDLRREYGVELEP